MLTDDATLRNVQSALLRRGRSMFDAQDIVQEAWLRVATGRRGPPVTQLGAFLMRVALNLSVDGYRRQRHQGEGVCLDGIDIADPAPGVEAQLLARERLARAITCLQRMPERRRVIFLAHRLDGLTYAQVAQQYGVSVSTVEKHIAEATADLTEGMKGW
jgi:RNA polymerase sigma factor (sigma-70 family)